MRYFRTRNQLRFVSGPCGSGKTEAAIGYIWNHRHQSNFLYVVPTSELIDELVQRFQERGVDVDVINGKTHPKHVVRTIVQYLKDPLCPGRVLLITWNAFRQVPFFANRDDWQIIIDEVPQLDVCHQFNIPHNMKMISEHAVVVECVNDKVGIVTAKHPKKLKKHLKRVRDDVDEKFKPFFKDVLSENRDVYVEIADWERLVAQGAFSSNEQLNQITFLSLLNKKLF